MSDNFSDVSFLSRIITPVVLAIIVSLQAWQLNTTQNLAIKVASMETIIQERTFDRYTRSEAESDNALLKQRIQRLEQWAQNLSERIRHLESTKENR